MSFETHSFSSMRKFVFLMRKLFHWLRQMHSKIYTKNNGQLLYPRLYTKYEKCSVIVCLSDMTFEQLPLRYRLLLEFFHFGILLITWQRDIHSILWREIQLRHIRTLFLCHWYIPFSRKEYGAFFQLERFCKWDVSF